jgi:hypothetical protein
MPEAGPDKAGVSERAAVSTASGGATDKERPLADARTKEQLSILRRLTGLRGGRCRLDFLHATRAEESWK